MPAQTTHNPLVPSSTLGGPTKSQKPALRWLFLCLSQMLALARVCRRARLRAHKIQRGKQAPTLTADDRETPLQTTVRRKA